MNSIHMSINDKNNLILYKKISKLNEDIEKLQSQLEKCKQANEVLITFFKIAKEVTQSDRDEPCRYDHNKNCQEHTWFGLDGEDCPVEKLRKALTEAKRIMDGED